MCAFELFLSVDTSLGRVDYSLLSDQTLMEILMDGLDGRLKRIYQDNDEMYPDVCEWSCIECDEDARVIKINIDLHGIRAPLELCYVPPKVKHIRITSKYKSSMSGLVDFAQLPKGMQNIYLQNNMLTGEIDLTQMPDGMETLNLGMNILTGEIDLTQMPDGMKDIHLELNRLSGEIDLTQLPDGLKYLYLNNNRFSGEIDLTQLPNTMGWLYLSGNQLTGGVDLTQLPDRMQMLHFERNQLSGPLVIKGLPCHISSLNASQNQFNAVAVLEAGIWIRIDLRESGVTSVVDENGREQDMKRFLR